MNIVRNQTMFNQPMLQKLTQTVANNEMANISMVLATPTILTTWYLIDPDLSETVRGYKNITDYIGVQSELLFKKVENLPMYGVDNLQSQATFNDELNGYDEDFTSSGVIYPNTIFPIPGCMFQVNNSAMTALYIVTDIRPTTVRSNPFIEITFKLFTRDPDQIAALERQVVEEFVTNMSSIGLSKSLVISKNNQTTIQEHLNTYLEIVYLYTMLFYDNKKAAFVFDGLPDQDGKRACYVDMTLWKFMFDEGIIIYDDLVTYANNNGEKPIDRVYTSSPDILIDEYTFRRSIIWRIYDKDNTPVVKRASFDEYRFPTVYEPTQRITKYQGQNMRYIENYDNHASGKGRADDFYIWDDEFLCRIRQNNKYEEFPLVSDKCRTCKHRCNGTPVECYNPYLRNAIISWYNNEDIDWGSIQIADAVTVENYYLIPIVMGFYKKYIQGLA